MILDFLAVLGAAELVRLAWHLGRAIVYLRSGPQRFGHWSQHDYD